MTPRERRLVVDHHELRELEASGVVAVTASGSPPECYSVRFTAPGLAPGEDGIPVARDEHEFAVYLHLDYPRRPPVITWCTPVFHPNLLGPDRHGGVCIGSWSPSESLRDLVVRLVELAGWRAFGLADALNIAAAAWAREHAVVPDGDVQKLVGAHA
ncbi:ubiquitin-conjugating enzyme E2 [Candidatus Solirubrobacter pratensis]|uniref:ubiquitin-conjugating enzyme E2 n=1 Tax=Candidatus Solirubrobacter pratensis TaxID=1298857 RepID=UPI000423DF73|nr:ubiquitin-conjugating enzyme E2 [Candidatus Solirubrobacter pratensis]